MMLLINTKTGANVREMRLPDGPTPRVGEVLEFPALAPECGGLGTFLVTEVTWHMEDGRLSAQVSALAAPPSDSSRRLRLREAGWMAPAQSAEEPEQ